MMPHKSSNHFPGLVVLVLIAAVGPARLCAQPTMSGAGWAARAELAFWESIKDSQDPNEFEAYLDAYPKGYFSSLAKLRIKTLSEGAEVAQQPQAKPSLPSADTDATARPGKPVETKAGSTFRSCDSCPKMVVIPAGRFQMGSDKGASDEKPLHSVSIDSHFAIGVYEVTVGEWDACVAEGGCPDISGAGGQQTLPIANVSWDDAQKYVKWLSEKTGRKYRLPSEAEWEYAARGGKQGHYWWGRSKGLARANCADCGSRWDGKEAAPVGSFKANPFGLYDVHGNIEEWTQDCWNPSYDEAPGNEAPRKDGDCLSRVLRGGSWALDHAYMRASRRSRYDRDVRYYQNGFRIVAELPAADLLPFAEALKKATNVLFSAATDGASGGRQQSFVIDPLIDGLSGEQSTATQAMQGQIADLVRTDHGQLEHREFSALDATGDSWVLIGTFTGVNKERKTTGVREAFRICLRLLDPDSGKVISVAKTFSQPDGVDITPTAFFRDSPAWVADAPTKAYMKMCHTTKPGDPIDPVFLQHLKAERLISRAIDAYDRGKYGKSKELFKLVSQMKGGDQLRTYSGLYLTNWKLGERQAAAHAFGKIIDYGLSHEGLGVKFPFKPNTTDLQVDPDGEGEPDFWLAQIAQTTLRRADCLEIVGHVDRKGPETLNKRLSIRRAELIKQRLESDAPSLATRMIATGKGSQENLIGSGTGDVRDALDRRIELDAIQCSPTG